MVARDLDDALDRRRNPFREFNRWQVGNLRIHEAPGETLK